MFRKANPPTVRHAPFPGRPILTPIHDPNDNSQGQQQDHRQDDPSQQSGGPATRHRYGPGPRLPRGGRGDVRIGHHFNLPSDRTIVQLTQLLDGRQGDFIGQSRQQLKVRLFVRILTVQGSWGGSATPETGEIQDVPWDAIKVSNIARLKGLDVREYQVVMRGKKSPQKTR